MRAFRATPPDYRPGDERARLVDEAAADNYIPHTLVVEEGWRRVLPGRGHLG